MHVHASRTLDTVRLIDGRYIYTQWRIQRQDVLRTAGRLLSLFFGHMLSLTLAIDKQNYSTSGDTALDTVFRGFAHNPQSEALLLDTVGV